MIAHKTKKENLFEMFHQSLIRWQLLYLERSNIDRILNSYPCPFCEGRRGPSQCEGCLIFDYGGTTCFHPGSPYGEFAATDKNCSEEKEAAINMWMFIYFIALSEGIDVYEET